MNNPRKNPVTATDVGHGDHAISLGPQKLGKTLIKCMSEVTLAMNLPPGPQAQMVLGLLKQNLAKIMGLSQEDLDEE